MGTVRVERRTTITLSGTRIPVAELQTILAEFGDKVIMGVQYHKAIGNDPREGDYVTLVFDHPAPITPSKPPLHYPPGAR